MRIKLRNSAPVIRRIESQGAVKWDKERRLKVALANDNGGPWWKCITKRSVADMERHFQEGSMASTLIRSVGGILGDHQVPLTDEELEAATKRNGKPLPSDLHFLYIQIRDMNRDVRMCLKESGVLQIVKQVAPEEIVTP